MSTWEGAAPWDPGRGTTGEQILNSKSPVEANKNDAAGGHGCIRTGQKVAPLATETTTHLYPCTIVLSHFRLSRSQAHFILRSIQRE